MSTILGIESTCDETAAAVVIDGCDVRSNVVATQVELHAKYRGVVPEIASRAHIENILPVIREALEKAHTPAGTPISLNDIDAISVTHRPGLIGSLLIGVTAAKTLAWALQKPLVGVDHIHSHLYSVMLRDDQMPASVLALEFPAVGCALSGGHTAIYAINSWTDVRILGSTIDDAVGEAYDKVAAILGLGYPGGPVIDSLAEKGDPNAIRFPRTLFDRDSLDFSFSGLKTSVLYHVRGHKGRERGPESLTQQQLHDVAAGFQAACVDVIVKKIKRAVRQTRARSVVIGGGVSANRGLRTAMADFQVPVFFPPLRYCTDNAAMSAGLAHVLLSQGQSSPLNLDAITYSQFIEE